MILVFQRRFLKGYWQMRDLFRKTNIMSRVTKTISIVFTIIALVYGCKEKENPGAKVNTAGSKEIHGIPISWIDSRVEKAKSRLNATDAGKVIWNAMKAHAGLRNWYSKGPLAFRFNYQPIDGSTQRDSYQVVDVWRSRALHRSTTDSTATYGWTGSEAWVKAQDSTAFAYDTKFWAMTPLYLMGFPFVLDGQGVNLEMLPPSDYLGRTNDVVKITFDPGTGDAPDDYYILHFDAETHLLIGTRYIVSYPQYFKKGEHLPEKFMEVGPLVSVDGILLPSRLKTHWTEEGKPGQYLTLIEITDYGHKGSVPKTYFDRPLGAKKL